MENNLQHICLSKIHPLYKYKLYRYVLQLAT